MPFLTSHTQNIWNVNGVLIGPFLSAFYQVLVTFFFVGVCVLFHPFFFSMGCVFIQRKKKTSVRKVALEPDRNCDAAGDSVCLCICTVVFFNLSAHVGVFICCWEYIFMPTCISMCTYILYVCVFVWTVAVLGLEKRSALDLFKHGEFMTAVYISSSMSILAHLLALTFRWQMGGFFLPVCGKAQKHHPPEDWPWCWTQPSVFER